MVNALMLAGIDTPTLNSELKAICFGMLRIVGRGTAMKGGFRYSTRNSLMRAISEVRQCVSDNLRVELSCIDY